MILYIVRGIACGMQCLGIAENKRKKDVQRMVHVYTYDVATRRVAEIRFDLTRKD